MKKTIKIMCVISFFILFITIGTIKSNAGDLYLSNLDFNVQINNDGSMNVTEKWDIDISETNTLYKVFKTDKSKYSSITNVTVKEITNNQDTNFINSNKWAYHVTKGYYYGTKNQDGDFEIGWGVGLDNSSGKRKYEISYTVLDAVTKYNDYAELYWQFVGEEFEVSADNITGTIYLPSNVSNIENIKVWGHTEDLNGTIYATDTNKIEFEINNYRSGRYVEIRTLFPSSLINTSGRIKNTDILQTVIDEETKWAEEANARRKRAETTKKILFAIAIIANVLIGAFFIKKFIKYTKKLKELKSYDKSNKLEYYRDLPDENATPGEAYMITNIKSSLDSFFATSVGNIFSATMLDLALKGYLEINQEKDGKKEKIRIKILKDTANELKADESLIYNFIKKAINQKEEIELKELEKYITKYPKEVEKLIKDIHKNVKQQLEENKLIDKEILKQYKNYQGKQLLYFVFTICTFAFIIILFPVMITLIMNIVACGRILKRLKILSQDGLEQKEKWDGLKRYMENFSMLDRREVPELVIWEKYLVFATVFGIADKVIKQLKIVYPNFDEISSVGTYTYMNLMMSSSFNTSFSKSISTSMSSAYSSGSGGGGGFSGGGGGGRRTAAVVAGR